MTERFMGLTYRDYFVKSKYGAQVALKAQTKADALYTGAELLNEPVENLHIIQPTDW